MGKRTRPYLLTSLVLLSLMGSPSTVALVRLMNNQYYGDDAVKAAAQYYGFKGPISPIARHVIYEEGFVAGTYDDHKGIPTAGVGVAREELMGKNFFTEVLPEYEEQARRATKGYATLPEEAQAAIVSMAYRGDWGKKTRAKLNKGDLKGAAKEYLDHGEYRKGKRRNATEAEQAVAQRMERNAKALLEAS